MSTESSTGYFQISVVFAFYWVLWEDSATNKYKHKFIFSGDFKEFVGYLGEFSSQSLLVKCKCFQMYLEN